MTGATGPGILRSAVLLAGGRSSRMGRPKALLDLGGEPMIARVARALEASCDELVVVAAAADRPGETATADELRAALACTGFARRADALGMARDLAEARGPVAGLAAGLAAARGRWAIVVPCDLPFLSPSLVAGLFATAEAGRPRAASTPVAVIPRRGGDWEPMPAVLDRAVFARLYAEQLERGELRPTARFSDPDVIALEGDALDRLDPGGASFLGVNDAREYARARDLLGLPA